MKNTIRAVVGITMLLGSSAWALPRSVILTVDQTNYYSRDFVAACDTAARTAEMKLPVVERNLSLPPGTLQIRERIISQPQFPGNPTTPHNPAEWAYSCVLEFWSKDKSVSLNHDATKLRTHLTKEEQYTACEADLNEVASHPGSIYVLYDVGASLFQGRICQVEYVEALKR